MGSNDIFQERKTLSVEIVGQPAIIVDNKPRIAVAENPYIYVGSLVTKFMLACTASAALTLNTCESIKSKKISKEQERANNETMKAKEERGKAEKAKMEASQAKQAVEDAKARSSVTMRHIDHLIKALAAATDNRWNYLSHPDEFREFNKDIGYYIHTKKVNVRLKKRGAIPILVFTLCSVPTKEKFSPERCDYPITKREKSDILVDAFVKFSKREVRSLPDPHPISFIREGEDEMAVVKYTTEERYIDGLNPIGFIIKDGDIYRQELHINF